VKVSTTPGNRPSFLRRLCGRKPAPPPANDWYWSITDKDCTAAIPDGVEMRPSDVINLVGYCLRTGDRKYACIVNAYDRSMAAFHYAPEGGYRRVPLCRVIDGKIQLQKPAWSFWPEPAAFFADESSLALRQEEIRQRKERERLAAEEAERIRNERASEAAALAAVWSEVDRELEGLS
jgi:hypothetical protein